MSPASPLVSVIIPVRNRRDLLMATLDGLQEQTEPDFEVVVVDDGSTDGSAEAAEARAVADPRIRVIRGDGQGAVAARTLAVDASQAAVLAFIDSDCVPDPKWLEVGLAALREGADLAQGLTEPAGPVHPDERSLWATREDGLYPTCNIFYRRSAYDAVGGFDQRAGQRLGFRPGSYLRGLGFGEDVLLGWAVRRRGATAFVPEARVRHHVFPPDPREKLTRAWNTGGFAALVREVPELRTTFLRHGVLLGGARRLPLYLASVLAVLGRGRLAGLVLAGWGAWHVRRYRGLARQPVRAVEGVAVDMSADVLAAAALAVGSARTRTPVL